MEPVVGEDGTIHVITYETRCKEVNLTYERRCEEAAGHEGWHWFHWARNDPSQGMHRWPGPSLP